MEVIQKLVTVFAVISIADAVIELFEVFYVAHVGPADFNNNDGKLIPEADRTTLCGSAASKIGHDRVARPGDVPIQETFEVTTKQVNPATGYRYYKNYNLVRCKDITNNDPPRDFYILQMEENDNPVAIYFNPDEYLATLASAPDFSIYKPE